ncbi:unnamed protein product, partial [Phaedon cochleariae]
RKYRYTHENSTFTEDQKLFYEKNGYIVIKNNVSHVLLDKLLQRFIDICENNVEDSITSLIKDPVLKKKGAKGQYLVNKIQDFLYDPVLWDYAVDKDVLDIVENIIGPNITGMHSMVINKPPDSDPDISKHPLHQDLNYFPFRPADKIVGTWTAMEDVNEKNGCLYVVPGSHKLDQLYQHEYPKGQKHFLYLGIQGMDHLPRVNVIMEKGDTIFFHPLLFHGSGQNSTKGFRKAISCHYAASDCHYINVENTIQEGLAREVTALLMKTMNFTSSNGISVFNEYFRLKSRIARGRPGNLQKLTCHL